MTPKNPQARHWQVQCAHCQKPFHFTPEKKAKAGKTGEVEIALECPYCQKQNLVTVPEKFVQVDVLLRGSKNQG